MLQPRLTQSLLRSLPPQLQRQFLQSLTPQEKAAKLHDWTGFLARDNQLPPPGDWLYWLLLAGRGFGKTRTGAETVRQWIKEGHNHVNFIGATADDVRAIMIEGESGILAICPDDERPRYIANTKKLVWPNGAVSLLFSAEEPERFRGKQHAKLWADEIASWRYPDSWDQALLGLRLGSSPQAVISTTPRPTVLVKTLMKDPKTRITGGSTYDNSANLAQAFIHAVVKKYEGTRLGRQELNAELLDDIQGALWSRANLDKNRRATAPDLQRIVVAVDPSGTSGKSGNKNDDVGIVVVGLGFDGRAYVLADWTCNMSPNGWGTRAITAYHKFKADALIAETNFGGAMVGAIIGSIDANVRFKEVSASRGKVARAEPVAALYEQERVSHVGTFAELEDQMCSISPMGYEGGGSPDRADALVWALTELMLSNGDGTQIIEFYRQQSAAKDASQAQRESPAEKTVTMKAPPNFGAIVGITGKCYQAGEDGLVRVSPGDVASLRRFGFEDAQE